MLAPATTPQAGLGSHDPQVPGHDTGQGRHRRWKKRVFCRAHVRGMLACAENDGPAVCSTFPLPASVWPLQEPASEGETAGRPETAQNE